VSASPAAEQTAHSFDPLRVRADVREAEQAARRLIARAAHLEKRAGRPRTDSDERMNLAAKARELRAAAEPLLAEISELSRRVSLT
jgi:hypothetical protein